MWAVRRNAPYLLQQAAAAVANTGLFGRVLSLLVILGYLVSFWPAATAVLVVTPGSLLPPRLWLWTALTHCLLELHWWQVLVDVLAVNTCTKLLEPLWGRHEMLFFFLLVNVLVASIASVFYLLLYMLTGNADLLFAVRIHGMAGYVAACSVAVKQIMPDHVVAARRALAFTNSRVPLLLVVVSGVLYACGVLDGNYVTQLTLGVLVSWTYLRFYQPHSNATRGDMAAAFAFSQFFPSAVQPLVCVISGAIYSCLVAARCCRRPIKKYDVGAPSSITISLPGVDAQDAERRRQKALKALNERLQRVESPPAWPCLDEDSTVSSTNITTPTASVTQPLLESFTPTTGPDPSAAARADVATVATHGGRQESPEQHTSDAAAVAASVDAASIDGSTSTTPSSAEIV